MESLQKDKKYAQLGDYVLLKTLGSGYTAKVKLGLSKKDNKTYAVKILKDSQNDKKIIQNLKTIKNEVNMMKELNHLNIVNLIDAQENGQYIKKNGQVKSVLYIVMENAAGGELFDYVANTGPFKEDVARTFYKNMLDGLEYIHKKKICHRDMKPENVLFDDQFNIKIADFGFATIIKGKQGTILGTESYMAPEIHMRMPYDGEKVDLFASAIILFIMVGGTPPFTKADPKDPYYKLITNNNFNSFWKAHLRFKPSPSFFTEEFKDFINKMLCFNSNERLNIEKIKEHPWMKGDTLTMDQIRQEFNQRKQKVFQNIEIELKQKAIEKEKQKQKQQQQKNQNLIYTGAKFRSIKEIQDKFEELIKEYPQLEKQRELAINMDDEKKMTDYYTTVDHDYLYKCLLICVKTVFERNNCQATLNENQYKMNFLFNLAEETVEIEAKLVQVEENVTCIKFNKKQGNLMTFYEQLRKLKEELDKHQE